MQNTHFSLLVGLFVILFTACSDSNPTDFYTESSSSEVFVSSSSIISTSSSNGIFSSSLEINSSSSFFSSSATPVSYGELIDERDGQIYKTIKIGEQTWMAQNLNYAYLQPTSTKDSSSECYNNELNNCEKFGRLYLWSATMDSAGLFSLDGKGCGAGSNSCKTQPSKGVRGICPENWHIPTDSDMKNYIDYANSSIESLSSLKHYWIDEKMLPDFLQDSIGQKHAFLWSSVDLYGEKLNDNIVEGLEFIKNDNLVKTSRTFKWASHPVRCVKDDEKFHVEHGELTDERDGQVYKTVKIGNQWWMAENLNYAYTKPYKVGHATFDSASFCYNNVLDSCAKYGRLYAWDLTMDCQNNKNQCNKYHDENFKSRGICPENWHIPSVNEWNTLIDYANHFTTDLKSTRGWLDDGNGSNALGFNLLPAGFYDFITIYDNLDDHDLNEEGWDPSEFHDLYEEGWDPSESAGKHTCFWTPAQWTTCLGFGPNNEGCSFDEAYVLCISSKDREVKSIGFDNEFGTMEIGYYVGIGYALSVRCIKDSTEAE